MGDKLYIECTVEFKIKGDNFVNYTKIQWTLSEQTDWNE